MATSAPPSPRAITGAVRPASLFVQWGRSIARGARRAPLGVVSAIILISIAIVAITAADIAPFDPLKTNFAQTRKPPTALHVLGTDNLGRDSFSRLIHGARITLFVAVTSVIIGDLTGFVLGLLSGYLGKTFDLITQRILIYLYPRSASNRVNLVLIIHQILKTRDALIPSVHRTYFARPLPNH